MNDCRLVPVDLLSELAEALAWELDARYPASVRSHEEQDRRYQAEMEPVLTARKIIAAAPAVQAEPVARQPVDELRFEYRHPKTGEAYTVSLSREEVMEMMDQELFEKLTACFCECEPIGETNVVDCRCDEYADQFELVTAPQPAEQQSCPEDIREGAPYDDPAFESLCREHEIWGTPAAAQCAVFWEAGNRVAEKQPAPDVAGLVNDAERWRYVRQFLSLDDVGDEEFCLGLVVDCEGLESAVTPHAARLHAERCAAEWVVDADYVGDISPLPPVTVEQAIDAALAAYRKGTES